MIDMSEVVAILCDLSLDSFAFQRAKPMTPPAMGYPAHPLLKSDWSSEAKGLVRLQQAATVAEPPLVVN